MMATKSHTHVQSIFKTGTAITNRAKQLIQKHPGIYSGDLINRLQMEIKSITSEDVNQMIFQLSKESYDFKGNLIYPPHTINPLYKKLKKLTLLNKELNDMDFEIFMIIIELKEEAKLQNTALRVISQNTAYSEKEVKYEMGILFKNKYILAKPSDDKPEFLDFNWDLIIEDD